MVAIGLLAVVCVVLFALCYMTQRRFGVLGLALTAGSLLSTLWAPDLVAIVGDMGLSTGTISTAAFFSMLLVIAPALLLLFSGPTYSGTRGRLIGAVLFAVLATVLIADPVSRMLVSDQTSRQVFSVIATNLGSIVTIGIVVSLLDLLAIHTSGGHGKPSKKH